MTCVQSPNSNRAFLGDIVSHTGVFPIQLVVMHHDLVHEVIERETAGCHALNAKRDEHAGRQGAFGMLTHGGVVRLIDVKDNVVYIQMGAAARDAVRRTSP